MVDFSRSFNSAWERMVAILFRPFDLGKWFTIGFSAFLAGFLQGGNGVNFNGNFPNNTDTHATGNSTFSLSPSRQQQDLSHQIQHAVTALQSMQVVTFLLIFGMIMVFALALIVLFYWLGARGQFMLLDNIVYNRAAIADPWHRYSRHGNAVFILHLVLLALSFALLLVLGVPALLLGLPLMEHHQYPTGPVLAALILLFIAFVLIGIVVDVFLFLFREWGIPLMFRNNLAVPAALRATWQFMCAYPGSTTAFILLRIALWIGTIFIGLLVCCATCCIAILPYLGTVALLPVIIFLKCFSLDVLAQFGPECDVFTTSHAPAAPGPTLQPPPG